MMKQAKILIVDDDAQNIKVAASALDCLDLSIGFAKSGLEALARLKQTEFDLILLDVMMPGMDGFEVCLKLKENSLTDKIPVLFLTAKTDDNSIEKAYEVGAHDYISKPFRPRELIARVKSQLNQLELLRNLEYMATRDSLTGIYNRRMFFQLGESLFAESALQLVVLMIDIDFFKRINDAYGHQVGDQVLKAISETIESSLPANAIFGRIGGEEFAILLQVSEGEAMQLAETMRERVAGFSMDSATGDSFNCTISIGLGVKKDYLVSLDMLLKVADDMLYQAKKQGRNRTILRQQDCS